MASSLSPAKTEFGVEEEIHLTKIPSLFRRSNLPSVVHVSHDFPPLVEGAAIVVQVLSTAGKRTNIEDITEQSDHLMEGDVVPAVLGKRRMFNGFSCDVPHTLSAGDVLYWSSGSGVVGDIRGSDPAWGQQLPVRVLGGARVSGKFLNIKDENMILRLEHLDPIAPVVCVAGTATNTGKSTTVTKVVEHFKAKGLKVACAKLTGMALLAELRKLSSTGADLVLGFMDAGLPSTCGDAAEEVVQVALGILHQLNQIQPDVIVVEFGASFLGLYHAESVLCSSEFKKHMAAMIMSASDPVAAWGAKQIMDRWAVDITAITGPVVNSKSFEDYVEETLGIPAGDNRGAMPKIMSLVESKVDDFKRQRARTATQLSSAPAMVSHVEWLPNEPLFHHMLDAFTTNPDHVLLHDWVKGTEATCTQLLTDMLHMRRQIVQALPTSMFDSRSRIVTERPFIAVLAPGNFDFVVAAFSILCCGAAFTSIVSTSSPEEASYILDLANASCILFSPEYQPQVSEILQYQATHKGEHAPIISIPISIENSSAATELSRIQIDAQMTMDPLSPGALLFSSGTTGPPKGIVRPRSIFYSVPESFPGGRVAISHRPPSWSSAVLPLLWRALKGNRTEVTGNTPRDIWERLRKGGVTDLKMAPRLWASLMAYFIDNIDKLPSEQREQYVEGARALQKPIITGGFGWPNVTKFWQGLLGRQFGIYCGSTEAGNLTAMMDEAGSALEGCIGKPEKGVEIKLSEGDHGEMLVKSPMMFTGYLGNDAATRAAFDDDGYYRSGDFARLVGDQYILEGRMSTDFIRCYGLWVSLREVETQLSELPYIMEAHIVSVDFKLCRQVAALIRLETSKTSATLVELRRDLQDKLPKYKLPTLLRTLKDDEQLPVTDTGKLSRKRIADKYFALCVGDQLPEGVEFYDGGAEIHGPRKAWDWGGMI